MRCVCGGGNEDQGHQRKLYLVLSEPPKTYQIKPYSGKTHTHKKMGAHFIHLVALGEGTCRIEQQNLEEKMPSM